MALDEGSVKSAVIDVLKSNDIKGLTMKSVRAKAAEALGVDKAAIRPFKALVKSVASAFVAEVENTHAKTNKSPAGSKRKSEGVKKKVKPLKRARKSGDGGAGGDAEIKKRFNLLVNVCKYRDINTRKDGLNVRALDRQEAVSVMENALADSGFACNARNLSEGNVRKLKKRYEEQRELEDLQQMNARWGVTPDDTQSSRTSRRGRSLKQVKYTYSSDEEEKEEQSGDSFDEESDGPDMAAAGSGKAEVRSGKTEVRSGKAEVRSGKAEAKASLDDESQSEDDFAEYDDESAYEEDEDEDEE